MNEEVDPRPYTIADFYTKLSELVDETDLDEKDIVVTVLRLATEYGTQMLGVNEYNYLVSRILTLTLAIQTGKVGITFDDLLKGRRINPKGHTPLNPRIEGPGRYRFGKNLYLLVAASGAGKLDLSLSN